MKGKLAYVVTPLVFLVANIFNHQIYNFLGLQQFASWAWYVFSVFLAFIAPILAIAFFGGGLRQIVGDLGLLKNPLPALSFGFVLCLPLVIGFGLKNPLNPDLTSTEILVGGALYPFFEEAFFRGLVFGQLYKRAAWNFWAAALVPALFFGLGHLYQSQDPLELLGIFGITAVGSVIFSALFVWWSGNLWAPFALHACLNIVWSVFAVDDTALGGAYANTLRFSVVAMALGFSYFAVRKKWLAKLAPAAR